MKYLTIIGLLFLISASNSRRITSPDSKVNCEEHFFGYAYQIKCTDQNGDVLIDKSVYLNYPLLDGRNKDIETINIRDTETSTSKMVEMAGTEEEALRTYARDYLHQSHWTVYV